MGYPRSCDCAETRLEGSSCRDSPLGEVLSVVAGLRGDAIEQLVQADEARSVDIPVCLLCLQMQIDGVGELLIVISLSDRRVAADKSLLVSYIGSSSSEEILLSRRRQAARGRSTLPAL